MLGMDKCLGALMQLTRFSPLVTSGEKAGRENNEVINRFGPTAS